MKSNLLRVFFEWALITSVLMSVGFFVWFYYKSRGVSIVDAQIANAQAHLQNSQAVINYLNNDCEEYSKANPEFARFLASLTRPAAPPVPVVAPGKPGTR
jgi:hypothetical protein